MPPCPKKIPAQPLWLYTHTTHTDKQVYLKNLQEFQGKLTAFICSMQYYILQTNYLEKKPHSKTKMNQGKLWKATMKAGCNY